MGYKRETNFSGANLSSATLILANLMKSNLTFACLFNAKLGATYLSNANLAGALLPSANLSGTSLTEANLSGALLSSGILKGVFCSVNIDDKSLEERFLSRIGEESGIEGGYDPDNPPFNGTPIFGAYTKEEADKIIKKYNETK